MASDRVERILRRIFGPGVDSANRLEATVMAIVDDARGELDAGVFWPVFLEAWPDCDSTWYWQPALLELIRCASRQSPARPYMAREDRSFLDSLPPTVTIYRGCSAPRVRGISWTTDKTVATGFRNGHRGIAVPDPVLVETTIKRESALAAFTSRKESEVLIDPDELRDADFPENAT